MSKILNMLGKDLIGQDILKSVVGIYSQEGIKFQYALLKLWKMSISECSVYIKQNYYYLKERVLDC